MNYLLSILSSVVTSSVLTATLVFLSKTWMSERIKNSIKNEYDVKLEEHKNKLKKDTDKEIETIKSDLMRFAQKDKIRFEIIYKRRIEIIETVHKLIRDIHESTRKYITIGKNSANNGEELKNYVCEQLFSLKDYYGVNSIFLPKEIGEFILTINDKMHSIIADFDAYIINESLSNPSQSKEKWIELYKLLETEIPLIYQKMRECFRDLIGTTEQE